MNRKVVAALTLMILGLAAPAQATTAKPTVKPTAKPAAKPTTKAAVKAPTKATTKKAAKPTGKSTSKPLAHSTKRPVVHHYYYHPHPRIGVPPSPSPVWPPKGFVSANGVYARVPSGQELVGILSSSKDPAASVNECAPDPQNPNLQAVACGAVLAASSNGCSWWEINSSLVGPDPSNPANIITLGTLRTLSGGTAAHSVSTIILVSGVPLANNMKFTSITAKCWLTQTDESVPSDIFTPAPGVNITLAPAPSLPGPTPTPSPTPTPGVTPSPSTSNS
jgi:hypothetical protein